MAASKGKSVAPVVSAEVASFEDRITELAERLSLLTGGDFKVQMVETIFATNTAEDLFGTEDQSTATSLENIMDEPLMVRGFRLGLSDRDRYPDSMKFFAILDTDQGAVTTGAADVVLRLMRAAELETQGVVVFPFYAKGTMDRTKGGNKVYKLVRISPDEYGSRQDQLTGDFD